MSLWLLTGYEIGKRGFGLGNFEIWSFGGDEGLVYADRQMQVLGWIHITQGKFPVARDGMFFLSLSSFVTLENPACIL